MIQFLGVLYVTAVALLSLFGLMGLYTLWQYWRHRHDAFPCPVVGPDELPPVTVQLPLYNERFVVERLIETAVALHYPSDRRQIQVIDDSTDDTTQLAANLVARYQAEGVNITFHHRDHRRGYKAGALTDALPQATGDYIAIFDADFKPPPDFLLRTIPHFTQNPRLGMIQTRWGHLNADTSPLTAAQAIAMDKHFAMEQTVRHRANLFPKFNGAGGVWRRACLEDAGGWQDDTVCEDLCLSTRALLRRWEFCFLNDVTAPAELPTTITAYKVQQARWAKGSTQCLQKFGRQIITSRNLTPAARLYGLLSMAAYSSHLLLLLLLLLQVPLIYSNYRLSPNLFVFSIIAIGQPLLFIWGQQTLYPDWRRRLRHLPALLIVAIGLAPSNSRAILQALFGHQHPFLRTPKAGEKTDTAVYRLPFDWIILVEILLAVYAALGLLLALAQQNYGSTFFLASCCLGLGSVAYLSLRELYAPR
jgi:cellulose synthase/poly-beta-1,6-N-acetylglucosamine synthase-like glycosyltransferase